MDGLEGVSTGTHRGAFLGPCGEKIPPTHKRVELPLALVFKIEGCKVTEEHVYFDNLGLQAQLGLVPEE